MDPLSESLHYMKSDTEDIHSKFSVDFEYDVSFTENAFDISNPTVSNLMAAGISPGASPRGVFFVEESVAEKRAGTLDDIVKYASANLADILSECSVTVFPGGESRKNFSSIERLCADIAERGLCRHSFVGIVGGGAFLDIVGLAASLVHRGVRQIRFPTTTLSQCDSGVGVKTGINSLGKKNYLGTFAPPFAVVNDSEFLKTLDYRDWISGVPEAFKVAMIADAKFFGWLLNNAAKLAERDERAMSLLIRRSATLHIRHIATSGDPFESGNARPLDFGHWAAHKLESMTDGAVRHGEAVGIGILIDSLYAVETGLLDFEVCRGIRSAFGRMGLPLFHEAFLETNSDGMLAILDGIEDFREHLGGELHITLPDGLGEKIEVTSINRSLMTEIIRSIPQV